MVDIEKFEEFKISEDDVKNAKNTVIALIEKIEELRELIKRKDERLKTIASNTYGTEFCNTEEENNAILAKHFFWHQNDAREALALKEKV